MPTRPDPERVGGFEWTKRTGGSLTSAERRKLIRPILRGQAQAVAGRLALLARRRPTTTFELPEPPDSQMARDAEEAAADQPPELIGHANRTWVFGRALAAVDDNALDDELFYVASLLHDVALAEAVTGQDFTLRCASAATPVLTPHCDADTIALVHDAITAHCTPGASIDVDGPLAFYVQAGAVCDLGGLRLNHLSASTVDATLDAHPRTGVTDAIIKLINAEVAAVPDGRFALLKRTGFNAALRAAPLPR